MLSGSFDNVEYHCTTNPRSGRDPITVAWTLSASVRHARVVQYIWMGRSRCGLRRPYSAKTTFRLCALSPSRKSHRYRYQMPGSQVYIALRQRSGEILGLVCAEKGLFRYAFLQ